MTDRHLHSLPAICRENRRRHAVKFHQRRPSACTHHSDIVIRDMADRTAQRLQKGFFGGPASSHRTGKSLALTSTQLFLFSSLKTASEKAITVAIHERAQAGDRDDIDSDADNAQ